MAASIASIKEPRKKAVANSSSIFGSKKSLGITQGVPTIGGVECPPKDFGITAMYRVASHLYDPYLPLYSYGNYWPVKIRHYCNGKSKRIYLHKDDPSVRSFLERNTVKNQTNNARRPITK